MPTDTTSAVISSQEVTAALSTNVSFSEQVNSADEALKNRNAATKDARAKWLALVNYYMGYNISMSRRRGTTDTAYDQIRNIKVYKANPVSEEERDSLRDKLDLASKLGDNYQVTNLLEHEEVTETIDAQFAGFSDFLRSKIKEYREASKTLAVATKSPGVDTKATNAAQEEAKKLADAFAEAMDKLEDSADVLTGVKDYIGVVEQIANISAVAQGRQV